MALTETWAPNDHQPRQHATGRRERREPVAPFAVDGMGS